MQGGVQVSQGAAVLATGLLAEWFTIPTVVGAWSLAGVLLLGTIWLRWPSAETVSTAITVANAEPNMVPSQREAGGRPDSTDRQPTYIHIGQLTRD
jgi:hypothetical protein